MHHRVRKAVFPVGGLGTRFLPATKTVPKEMLPVVDKPLIHYAVEEALAAGIEEFIFVTSRGKHALEDYFDRAYEIEAVLQQRNKAQELAQINQLNLLPGQVSYVRQMDALGLGHAIWCARKLLHNEAFAVILPDDLILGETPCIGELLALHEQTKGIVVAAIEVSRTHTQRYGILDVQEDDGKTINIRGMVEKPKPENAPSNLSITGRYILTPAVFPYLETQQKGSGGEIQLTDAIAQLIGQVPVHGLRFSGNRFDCGDKTGFLAANIAVALTRSDMQTEIRSLLTGLLNSP